jgi:hypothetical protein
LPEPQDDGSTAERWSALLDELERDTVNAGAREGLPWRPPADLGPLPLELLGRAQELAAAQQHAMAALEEEKTSTRRHLTALRSLPQHRDETGPVYLDASG